MKTSRKKSVNIFIELFFVFFCAAKSYEFVSFIQKKITLPSCDVSLECAAIL